MTTAEFRTILQNAINQEIEAATFYHDLQSSMQIESNKVILKELEDMEWGHKAILENLTSASFNDFEPQKIQNLKIAETLVDPPVSAGMTIQEVLMVAIKREERAWNLYSELAELSEEDKIKNIFLKLATEEAKHKLQLETIYDSEILTQN